MAPEDGLSDDPQVRNERRLRLLYGESVEELEALTREQVIERHDAHVKEARSSNKQGVRLQWLERAQVYRDELTRRETVRLTKSLNRLTKWIVWLTVIITIATLVGVGLTLWTLLSGA
jgi:CHASE3 domain sensor protein